MASSLLLLETVQLLGGGAESPLEETGELVPLEDGASRGDALGTLRSGDALLLEDLLLPVDATAAAAPGHREGIAGVKMVSLCP